jgi:heme/copper-type cytochrome/quinol oxidase subunit 3
MAVTEAPGATPALPPAPGPVTLPEPTGVTPFGMAMFVAADAAVLGGLLAALFALAFVWPPPEGARLGAYLPTMITLTVLLSAVSVQWAVWAIRRNDQRNCLFALGLTAFLGLAALNGEWYELAHLTFAIGKHPFDTFVYVLTGFHLAHALAGVVLLVAMLARTTTGEFSADEHGSLTATAMFWQFANLAWAAAYAVLWVKP